MGIYKKSAYLVACLGISTPAVFMLMVPGYKLDAFTPLVLIGICLYSIVPYIRPEDVMRVYDHTIIHICVLVLFVIFFIISFLLFSEVYRNGSKMTILILFLPVVYYIASLIFSLIASLLALKLMKGEVEKQFAQLANVMGARNVCARCGMIYAHNISQCPHCVHLSDDELQHKLLKKNYANNELSRLGSAFVYVAGFIGMLIVLLFIFYK